MHSKSTIAFFSQTLTSLRVIAVTMGICCLFYGAFILIFAQAITPESAEGSLVRNANGDLLGSKLIAQGFSSDRYLWPRPSAVGYNASASGGSNLSPANPELRYRAQDIIRRLNFQNPVSVPADLMTASGSGLDPHITLKAAMAQSERIAAARSITISSVAKLFQDSSIRPGGFLTAESLVNVLEMNLALDRIGK
jgi:potassium-transporting ATPase KdpC subunit